MDIRGLKQVRGYISDSELAFLYDRAQNTDGVILEIGSWVGRSTLALALGARAGRRNKIYAIDCSFPAEFYENIKKHGAEDFVIPMAAFEQEAIKNWRLPIALFFSDVHFYDERALANLLASWGKYLAEGGIIALNNVSPSFRAILEHSPVWGLPIPKKIGKKYILNSGQFKNCGLAGTILYGAKCARITLADKLKNQAVSLKIDFYTFLFQLYLLAKKMPQPIKNTVRKALRLK